LLHWKGAHLGLAAFARLLRDRPKAEYWIVGGGPEEANLRQLARQLGVTDRVKIWGRLGTLDEVYDKLRQSDVLVHAALHEAFGNVCLEALSSGRPVLCLNLGGPALQVTPECGYAAPADSPETAIAGLAGAMRRLHDDPALRLRMSEAARHRARDAFSWEKLGKAMNDFYASVATRDV
jgi:glycosyltransferase involved in cell wall biosynthesis